MLQTLQVVTLLLLSVTMALALAHALEYPGKKRLASDTYLAVQQIYYPGFTFAGFAEPLTLLPLLALVLVTPRPSSAFWLTVAAFVAVATLHAVYWVITAPVNKYWVAAIRVDAASSALFSAGGDVRSPNSGTPDWTELRDRWETSHLIRAALAFAALLLFAVAVTLR